MSLLALFLSLLILLISAFIQISSSFLRTFLGVASLAASRISFSRASYLAFGFFISPISVIFPSRVFVYFCQSTFARFGLTSLSFFSLSHSFFHSILIGKWSDDNLCSTLHSVVISSDAHSTVMSGAVLGDPSSLLAYHVASPLFTVVSPSSRNNSTSLSPISSSSRFGSDWGLWALKSPHHITFLPMGSLLRSSTTSLSLWVLFSLKGGI